MVGPGTGRAAGARGSAFRVYFRSRYTCTYTFQRHFGTRPLYSLKLLSWRMPGARPRYEANPEQHGHPAPREYQETACDCGPVVFLAPPVGMDVDNPCPEAESREAPEMPRAPQFGTLYGNLIRSQDSDPATVSMSSVVTGATLQKWGSCTKKEYQGRGALHCHTSAWK